MRQVPVAVFVRVSSKDQDYQRQVSDLTAAASTRGWQVVATLSWKGSATKRRDDARPEVQQLRELVAAGQVRKVLITEVSRLARRPSQAHALLEELTDAGVSLYLHRYGMETLLDSGKRNPAAGVIFAIAADYAQAEVEGLADRIRSGQAEARRQGVRIGRPPGATQSEEKLKKKYPKVLRHLQGGLTVREIARLAGCSTNTVLKVKALVAREGAALSSQEGGFSG